MVRVEETIFCYACKPDDVADGRVQASFYQCEAKFKCENCDCDATAADILLGTCCVYAKKKLAPGNGTTFISKMVFRHVFFPISKMDWNTRNW